MRDEHLFGIARQRRHADLVRDFRWDIPARFNFGVDVVDAWAAERNGPALAWENAAGEEAHFTFADMARLSNRMASALRAAGLKKGDRVLVMLPRSPEWQVALVACLKVGAVVIPAIEMLTRRDIAYRVVNSEAVAAICRGPETGKFEDVRNALSIRIALGGAPGWTSWESAMASGTDHFAAETVGIEDPALMEKHIPATMP